MKKLWFLTFLQEGFRGHGIILYIYVCMAAQTFNWASTILWLRIVTVKPKRKDKSLQSFELK